MLSRLLLYKNETYGRFKLGDLLRGIGQNLIKKGINFQNNPYSVDRSKFLFCLLLYSSSPIFKMLTL